MFEPLNAEDPEAGKGILLLAYFLQSILLPLSSCGQRFFYDGFVEAKKKNSKKCHRVHLYCIVLYCIVLYFGRHLELQVEKTRD